jgi:hypothetical protein
MAREERCNSRHVARLVEQVGAEDQIERSAGRRSAPIADHEFERLGGRLLLARAGRHDLERPGLPIEERHPGAARRGREAAGAESTAEIEHAAAGESRPGEYRRDQ